MPSSELPPITEAGELGDWEFTDRYGSVVRLEGDFLGMGSSHRPFHKHSFPPYAERGQHCSTCRWMEIRIFQEHTGPGTPARYLVVQTGRSIVPGDDDLTTFGWAENSPAVVTALMSWGDNDRAFFTFVAKRALETAAEYDENLRRTYQAALERVVT